MPTTKEIDIELRHIWIAIKALDINVNHICPEELDIDLKSVTIPIFPEEGN